MERDGRGLLKQKHKSKDTNTRLAKQQFREAAKAKSKQSVNDETQKQIANVDSKHTKKIDQFYKESKQKMRTIDNDFTIENQKGINQKEETIQVEDFASL